jgi:hypothetical protein
MHIRNKHKILNWELLVTICLVVMLPFVTGCASNDEVLRQLEATNKALLNSTVPGEVLPDSSKKKVAEPWEEPSARIDAFIAAHPNDIPTASALRVRQAMLLLAHRQYDLAGAAFDQATELKLARDKALKALKEELIWWFKLDQKSAPGNDVDDKIDAFSKQIATLNDDPENESIRDYLAEMRAWIQLYAASHAVNGKMMARDIGSAIDNYAETLTDDDITAINTGKTTPGLGPVSVQVRRQVRAMEVIKRAAEIVGDPKFDGATVVYESEKARKIMAIN